MEWSKRPPRMPGWPGSSLFPEPCEEHDLVPIVYGLPRPELEERAARGEVYLGGCVWNPHWSYQCRRCHRYFGSDRQPSQLQLVPAPALDPNRLPP